MKSRIAKIGVTALLFAQVSTFPVQAAEFSTIQPYVLSNNKIGFTNGEKLVTKAIYDSIHPYKHYVVVSTAGKYGILDGKTGKTLTPVIWDSIELANDGKIAIVQKGGWFQHLNLTTQQLSAEKFVGAHTYFLSEAYPDAVVMGGQKTTMLDPSGKVLIPLFAGKISFADLTFVENEDEPKEKQVRYVLTQTANQLTLYDPVTLQPKFTLNHAEYLPQDGAKSAYIRVRVAGKEGLVDSSGTYVLEPKYKKLTFWNHGYVQVKGEQGIGLWRNGRMLAEPLYAEVGIESGTDEVFSTKSAGKVTYHSSSQTWSYSFKPGAEIVHNDYVLGQDLQTGMYGVVKVGGDVVIPFQYPRVEGPPAARLLVRQDGKKGLLPAYELPMEEPQFWFDTLTTLGSYSMLSIQDGNKIGLYSETKGLLLSPQQNRVIHYEQNNGKVRVTEPDGKILYYGFDGKLVDPNKWLVQDLTDRLSKRVSLDNKTVLIDRETDQQIGKAYTRALYLDEQSNLVVGMNADSDLADLFTAGGKLLTQEMKVLAQPDSPYGMPVTLVKIGDEVYSIGKKENQTGLALLKLEGDQLTPISPFDYRDIQVRPLKDKQLLIVTRADGRFDLWADAGEQGLRMLEEAVLNFDTIDQLGVILVKHDSGWDAYTDTLQKKTNGNYRSMQLVASYDEKDRAIAVQDRQTGLYGLLSTDLNPMTQPVYESIQATDHVFLQSFWTGADSPPFVFTTKQHFGYLDELGKELFKTSRTGK
ncbi:WG repeat-containing protein [Brevibacillus invocatus]|uniref:WG repeat-containing protein n=1 Tax=Brevibacillus invocatus TaxID=173959 RepID=A0A3M8C2M0_9BACL|nr:WG repeat-containing protein [Brevibacillus invocatus]RNB69942.1 WG repeat-containing protein [Brevibacillus invocatus]